MKSEKQLIMLPAHYLHHKYLLTGTEFEIFLFKVNIAIEANLYFLLLIRMTFEDLVSICKIDYTIKNYTRL